MIAYSHTRTGYEPSGWELLETPLEEVEALAGEFGSRFHASEWAEALGRCHDLGKGSREFQDYLHASSALESQDAGAETSKPGRVNHSTLRRRRCRSRWRSSPVCSSPA